MHVIRDIGGVGKNERGATLVLGSFDGVHLGHRALVAAARARPYAIGVLTFSPHPRLLLQPPQKPFLLTPGREKHVALGALGTDFCVELEFTREFASITAEDFVGEILVRRLAARHLIFGENFRFGAGRKGDAALLQQFAVTYGFTVDPVAPVVDESGAAYSSTRIRACLHAGDVAGATAMLGRPWVIKPALLADHAESMHTAHFHFGEHLKPRPGHYLVKLKCENRPSSDAHLVISEDDDLGRLEAEQDIDLRQAATVALEFVDFVGPLTSFHPSSGTRVGDGRYF